MLLRIHRRGWRVAAFAVFAMLLCAGALGSASQVKAGEDAKTGLYFYLYPDQVPYACVGKPIQMYFLAGVKQEDSGPLASLVPPEIRVTALDPLVGKLSKRSWTINRFDTAKRFTYTPTKTGDETLIFYIDTPGGQLDQTLTFPVIYCRYRVSIHSEIQNIQGGIHTNIFYDGQGRLDVSRNDGDSGWTISGYGTTTFEGYSDGTEGDLTCVTTSPGKGAGTFWIDGDGDPSAKLKPVFHFTDIGAGVGLACKNKKGAQTGSVPRIGWLPNAGQSGVLTDLAFNPKGDNRDLDISQFNDTRWTDGANQGNMLITIVPETSQ